jgi:xanthine dehydrogenase accessory factor
MAFDVYKEIYELRSKGLRAALATIILSQGATPRKDSSKMLVYSDGRKSGTIGGGFTEAEVCREALSILETGKPKLLSFDLTGVDHEESALVCGGFMQVYVEPILPDPVFFVFGAGFVSRAVADAVKPLGFKIAVIDDRKEFANPEKFPNADDFYVDRWEDIFKKLPIDEFSYLFIATRGHRLDLDCLRFAVGTSARYIGMLGSLKKVQSLFQLLKNEGVDPARFERVCVPAGLDIGSETAEEIAASIAAELVAVRKNLQVSSMRSALRGIRNAKTSSSI